MTTATATQTAAACACELAHYTITGIPVIERVDNACPTHGLPVAAAATREAPQPQRKQSLPICRGRKANGRKCSNDAAPGSWLCHSCRQG